MITNTVKESKRASIRTGSSMHQTTTTAMLLVLHITWILNHEVGSLIIHVVLLDTTNSASHSAQQCGNASVAPANAPQLFVMP
jgi:hypothetical protein